MKKIGIVIAMESELAPYTENAKTEKVVYCGKDFYLTTIGFAEVIIVYSGIGKVNAAYACTLLCQKFAPDFLISTGVSGGLGRSQLLSTVVASSTCQHDCDTTALGDPIGFVNTVNQIYFPTDPALSDILCAVTGAQAGVFACGDRFVADEKTAEFIVKTFDAVACDMESGAIGQVAYLTGIPYVAVRIISDGAGSDASMSFKELTERASVMLHKMVVRFISMLP